MKINKIFALVAFACLTTLTSCFEDETTIGNGAISEIVIDSTSISRVYNINKNQTLVITPRVSQQNGDKQLNYIWEINLEPVAYGPEFTYVGKELGSFNCRLIVENSDGKSFFAFKVNVNSPYEEGITVISNDEQGKGHLAFMLSPADGSKPTGFMQEECFSTNNPDLSFAAYPSDMTQSNGSLIIACKGDAELGQPGTIYYMNEKTFVVENILTAPEYPDFRPTRLAIPSIGTSGLAYPILCENGNCYEFSVTEGALAKPTKMKYNYAQTVVVQDAGTAGNYNLLFWDKEINALANIYRGYGPYYCSKTYHLSREDCKGSANYFDGRSIVKMELVRMTDEQLKTQSPSALVITYVGGMYQKTQLATAFWEYNYETMENVLIDNIGNKSGTQMCGFGQAPINETTPCVVNQTYTSMLFGDGNKVRRWNYTSNQFITQTDVLQTVGSDNAIITGMEMSADHNRTYVAFYEPSQSGLNGSVWVIDTDKGTVLDKYDNVCYRPVKIMYKKK